MQTGTKNTPRDLNFEIYLGEVNSNSFSNSYSPKKIFVHPNYNGRNENSRNNAVCLIKLKRTIEPNKNIQLATFLHDHGVGFGDVYVGTGWGITENGHESDRLKYVGLPVLQTSDRSCKEQTQDYDQGSTICLQAYKQGFCGTDIGGPLFQENSENLMGFLVHAGSLPNSKLCDTNKASIALNFKYYRNWIIDTLNH